MACFDIFNALLRVPQVENGWKKSELIICDDTSLCSSLEPNALAQQ
jgi:hypothetical protein